MAIKHLLPGATNAQFTVDKARGAHVSGRQWMVVNVREDLRPA